jgi:predicted XRE-type DNA-binding protein
MNSARRKRLQDAGWRVGTAQEFLQLSDEEAAFVDLKLALARALAARRERSRLTQTQVAKLLGSSQSRVAKMEAGDATVSADLLIRGLLALGAKTSEVGRVITEGESTGRRGRAARSRARV